MTKTVVTSKVGALAAFTKKKMTCLGCKVNHHLPLCILGLLPCLTLFYYNKKNEHIASQHYFYLP